MVLDPVSVGRVRVGRLRRTREAARALAGCVLIFVARLHSPYREAVTLVDLSKG